MVLEKIKNMEIIQQSLVHQLNTTQSQLTNTTTELTKTKDELTNTTDQLTNTIHELTNTNAKLTNTTNELTKTKGELTKTELELEKTKIEVDKLHEEKNSTVQTLTRVNSSLSYLFHKTVTYNQHIYYLSYPHSYVNINQSEQICQLLGGYLVEIGDQAEYDVIVDLIKTGDQEVGLYYYTYIGMTDREVEGRWRYVCSGDDVTFTKWSSGRPSDGKSLNCAVIRSSDNLMYDWSCKNNGGIRYLCEVEGK